MFAVVATDIHNGIGKNGNLLYRVEDDMKRFRELTLGKKIIMGRKTFESLPDKKPLPGRENYILSRSKFYYADGCHVFNSVKELLEVVGTGDDVAVIGGAEIYKLLLPYCDTLYATTIFHDGLADTFFPKLTGHWELDFDKTSDMLYDHVYGVKYQFATYRKRA